jgi:hypothetical protein
MHASQNLDYKYIDSHKLATFDAFLFGIPTRYGNFPGQWKVRFCSFVRRLHVNSPWTHPFQHVGVLGYHWPSMDFWRSIRKVRWSVYLNGWSRRGTGVDCYRIHVNLCPPRNHICSVGLCEGIWAVNELD